MIELVALDADDTLWHTEAQFIVTQERFAELLAPFTNAPDVRARLDEAELHNLHLFGYGVKGFTLSMVETAIELSEGTVSAEAIHQIIGFGKEMLMHPVELLDGVAETIELLGTRYRLALITKGELFHQETKIAESGLADHFEFIEIVSEKTPDTYEEILSRVEIEPASFVMVGNSMASDIVPVLEVGGSAVHIPSLPGWYRDHAEVDEEIDRFYRIGTIKELPSLLAGLAG